MKKSHCINIRIDFEEDDAFEFALAEFRTRLLESLKRQTSQDFDIVVRCQERHMDRVASLHPKIKPYIVLCEERFQRPNVSLSLCKFEDTRHLEKYYIQTIIDCDDLVRADFVSRIEQEFQNETEKRLLNFKILRFNVRTFELTECLDFTEQTLRGSMFLSLFCPDLDDYTFCWEHGHVGFPKVVDYRFIEYGYCCRFDFNKITERDGRRRI